ncbi:hypothetical protein BVZ31_17410 [Alcaligenes faecalis]|nr:hypothetical protein BVZ30_07070 [Alcaligenes faecalis]OSZ47859.1 hypothetical protein BVZ31_17410 [Alcaligenes faecalis]OSZ48890.1 hypothetical protein BVZ32_18880 [Alcaligenes faecalis]
MKTLIPLSDTTIRSVKPGDPRKRLSDGNGLYLLLFVNGGSHSMAMRSSRQFVKPPWHAQRRCVIWPLSNMHSIKS